MKPFLIAGAAILSLVSASAQAALEVGAVAPRFSAAAAQGDRTVTVDLSVLLEKGPVVIHFFPSAFTDTSGTREFADNLDAFRAAGATVIGMSRDSIDTLARFTAEVGDGRFPAVSADKALVNAFDVNDGAMFNTRTTYVIAPTGRIAFVHDDPDARDHVKKALAFLQAIKR